MRTAVTTLALVLTTSIAPGCDALDSDNIGEQGGIVVSEDGRMALEIPPGALQQETEISIQVIQGPEGSMSPMYAIEPMGLTFEKPATLVFDYDDQTLADHDAQALTMVAHREARWTYLGDQHVDDEDQTVSASLLALSGVTIVVED